MTDTENENSPETGPDNGRNKLRNVVLDDGAVIRRAPEIEHERAIAIFDLIEDNRFDLVGEHDGPYELHLAIQENRLQFDVRDDGGASLAVVPLPLSPFRRIVKDYFTVCESYFTAIKTASPSQIEAIDMGRRGLHDEGSELLRERLREKIVVDHDTSRRLFTLLCVLHVRG